MWVEVTSPVSANAYWGWKTEVENGTAHITAREVMVSPIHPSAYGKIGVPLEGVEEVYLCGRLIWQEGEIITREVLALLEAKTPYVGDPSALNRIAHALYNRLPAPCTMELETSARPYRWTLVYPDDDWELNPAGDAETLNARLESAAPLMLALVDNLDEVAWTYPESNGQRQTCVVTLEEANARLESLTDAYNDANGTDWEALESVKDYAQSPVLLRGWTPFSNRRMQLPTDMHQIKEGELPSSAILLLFHMTGNRRSRRLFDVSSRSRWGGRSARSRRRR